MKQSFVARTWRSKETKGNLKESLIAVVQADMVQIENKFIEVITSFIRSTFHYDKIKVVLVKKAKPSKKAMRYFEGKLEHSNDFSRYYFVSKLFNDLFYEFTITHIPATSESRHIKIFFWVLRQYIRYFYENLTDNVLDAKRSFSPDFINKSDIWLYNIQRTILVEYLYNLFNTAEEGLADETKWIHSNLRYDLDLINSILDFAFEMSTRKIENKEIHCGFVFHDETEEVLMNLSKHIRLTQPLDFGDFNQLKNVLEISDGTHTIFNVTNKKVTHLLAIDGSKQNNWQDDIIASHIKSLVLLVKGTGRIYFSENYTNSNRIILEIIHSRPIIRDIHFMQRYLGDALKVFVEATQKQLDLFVHWVVSLSEKRKGTSLVFCNTSPEMERLLIKKTRIHVRQAFFLDQKQLDHDLRLLDGIVKPDGAVLFDSHLIPTHMGTILPISSTTPTNGGARHNSVANYTKKNRCLGIVISEDGPITLFRNGRQLIKF